MKNYTWAVETKSPTNKGWDIQYFEETRLRARDQAFYLRFYNDYGPKDVRIRKYERVEHSRG